MLVFTIENDDVKNFMNKLLTASCFDSFEVREIELETIVKYSVDGRINKEYLQDAEEHKFALWSELRPYIFQLIKGKKKPRFLKMVLSANVHMLEWLDENAASASINLVYEKDRVMGTTGTSQKSFSMDKILDNKWEEAVKAFLKKNSINIKL